MKGKAIKKVNKDNNRKETVMTQKVTGMESRAKTRMLIRMVATRHKKENRTPTMTKATIVVITLKLTLEVTLALTLTPKAMDRIPTTAMTRQTKANKTKETKETNKVMPKPKEMILITDKETMRQMTAKLTMEAMVRRPIMVTPTPEHQKMATLKITKIVRTMQTQEMMPATATAMLMMPRQMKVNKAKMTKEAMNLLMTRLKTTRMLETIKNLRTSRMPTMVIKPTMPRTKAKTNNNHKMERNRRIKETNREMAKNQMTRQMTTSNRKMLKMAIKPKAKEISQEINRQKTVKMTVIRTIRLMVMVADYSMEKNKSPSDICTKSRSES